MAEDKTESKSSAGASSPCSPRTKQPNSPHSPRQPRRVKLSEQQLESLNKDELLAKWRELDSYVESLEARSATQEGEISSLRNSEDKYRQQYAETSHREKLLARRLASKEQELQEYLNQITEMKAAHAPSAMALRSALLDPAVNILIQKLRQELITTKAKLEDTQNELSAWKFTPDSNTGKRLMAKCRLLYQENEELGRMIASGRIAKLEGELALQKSFSEEVKKSQSELDEFIQDLDEDVEGMQSTIYFLQQELRKARESVTLLQQENATLKNSTVVESNLTNGLSPHTPPIEMKKEHEHDETESKTKVQQQQQQQQQQPSTPAVVKNETEGQGELGRKGARTPPMPVEKESSPCNNEQTMECNSGLLERNDDSSCDSSALIIKVENEELSEHDGDEDEQTGIKENDEAEAGKSERDDRDEGVANRRTLRVTTKMNSRGKANGEEVSTRTTRGRERTKREKSAPNSDDEQRGHKKKRRESMLSLEYNETDDDALVLTNGETLQSDQE